MLSNIVALQRHVYTLLTKNSPINKAIFMAPPTRRCSNSNFGYLKIYNLTRQMLWYTIIWFISIKWGYHSWLDIQAKHRKGSDIQAKHRGSLILERLQLPLGQNPSLIQRRSEDYNNSDEDFCHGGVKYILRLKAAHTQKQPQYFLFIPRI